MTVGNINSQLILPSVFPAVLLLSHLSPPHLALSTCNEIHMMLQWVALTSSDCNLRTDRLFSASE